MIDVRSSWTGDGVINRERADYVKSWSEFHFLPGVLATFASLAALNAPIFVVTNQSVIGRNIVSQQTIDAIHASMVQAIVDAGGRIDQIYCCPHHPDAHCTCRKPAPGMLLQAAEEHKRCLSASVFVGDAITDAMAAHAAGCTSLLVRSGRHGTALPSLAAEAMSTGALLESPMIVDDLASAAAVLADWHRSDTGLEFLGNPSIVQAPIDDRNNHG